MEMDKHSFKIKSWNIAIIVAMILIGFTYRIQLIFVAKSAVSSDDIKEGHTKIGKAVDERLCPNYGGEYELEMFQHFLSMLPDLLQTQSSKTFLRDTFKGAQKQLNDENDTSLAKNQSKKYANDNVSATQRQGQLTALRSDLYLIQLFARDPGYALLTTNTDDFRRFHASALQMAVRDRNYESKNRWQAATSCERAKFTHTDKNLGAYICERLSEARRRPFSFTGSQLLQTSDRCQAEYALHERRGGAPTRGGSNFRVEKRYDSGLRVPCSSRDLRNGTAGEAGCFALTAVHLFHDWLAFAQHYGGVMVATGTREAWRTRGCDAEDGLAPATGWVSAAGSPRRWFANGRPARVWLLSPRERACLQTRVRSLHVIGSSHMRYMYNYLEYALDGTILHREKNRDMRHGHLHYYARNHIETMGDTLLKIFSGNTTARASPALKDVIILNPGAWDLAYKTLGHFIDKSRSLIGALTTLKQSGALRNVRVFWIPPFVFPERLTNRRNSVVAAAAGAHLRPLLLAADVTEVDAWRSLLLVNNATVARDHYFVPVYNRTAFVGGAGYVFVNDLVTRMCDLPA